MRFLRQISLSPLFLLLGETLAHVRICQRSEKNPQFFLQTKVSTAKNYVRNDVEYWCQAQISIKKDLRKDNNHLTFFCSICAKWFSWIKIYHSKKMWWKLCRCLKSFWIHIGKQLYFIRSQNELFISIFSLFQICQNYRRSHFNFPKIQSGIHVIDS